MYPAAQFALDHATEILVFTLIFLGWLDLRYFLRRHSKERRKQEALCQCERCMKKRFH